MNDQFTVEKVSFLRKVVNASASITRKKNTIHSFTEIDISIPLSLISEYKNRYNEKLSFSGYLVACLAKALSEFPRFNSFISGNKLIILKELNISILVERKIKEEYVPEPLVLTSCQRKGYLAIHNEIRNAQKKKDEKFGNLSSFKIIRFIPRVFLKVFVSIADKSKKMAVKYGKIAITSVGMFCKEPVWFIPHGSATVLLTVGSTIKRAVKVNEGYENREHLCLTVSFDHDIIDGAPAARFMNKLIDEIKCGEIIQETMNE